MPRVELLALSPDDLAVLTNRGVVKRAQRELDSGEVTGEFSESDTGEVRIRWSDGVECLLPAGKVIAEGRCTCASTETCRHIVRTVLEYQRRASLAPEDVTNLEPPAPPGPWDPGSIADADLAVAFRAAALAKAREVFDRGLLVELVRSAKPSARFHVPPHTVRFLVPGDVRYTHCDCAEAAPCRHVLLAIWAFRRLDQGADAGLVSTQQAAQPVPSALLDDVEQAMTEWLEQGLSGAPRTWIDRLARLEARCRAEGLTWPAEVVDDLAREFERYLAHDALFDPTRVVDLIGELVIRSDAVRSDTGAVPQLLIRGSAADRPSDVGSARYLGLGCGVQVRRKSVSLSAYLQDVATGTVVAVGRDFADPAVGSAEPPREFTKLAQAPAVQGATFAALGAGQITVQSAKRSPPTGSSSAAAVPR